MNQKQLTETVRKFFDHIEWQYDFDGTDNYFMTGSRFEGGVEYCNVIVDVEDEFVHCYAVVPFEVPAASPRGRRRIRDARELRHEARRVRT